jgi:hypothetical protein
MKKRSHAEAQRTQREMRNDKRRRKRESNEK